MTDTTVAPTRSRQISAADLLWVTLRQHRGLILSTIGGLVLLCGYMAWTGLTITDKMRQQNRCDVSCAPLSLLGVSPDRYELVRFETAAVAGIGLIIGMFWAAPLLAVEYERRTTLLAWSQDVRPTRWLAGKVVPLALLAAVLAAGTGQLAAWLGDRAQDVGHEYSAKFQLFNFEAFGPIQIAYALFGFALGLLASAVFRRVLPALAATAVVFVIVRWAIVQIRPYYQAPMRRLTRVLTSLGSGRTTSMSRAAMRQPTACRAPSTATAAPPWPPERIGKTVCVRMGSLAGIPITNPSAVC